MTPAPSRRPPLSPGEGWLSDGRHVLRFRPTRWERQVQRLEITTGRLIPEVEPRLENCQQLTRGARQEGRKTRHPGRGP